MNDRAEPMPPTEQWRAYCDALRLAGEHVLASNPDASPEVHADGIRYLLGLTRAGIGQSLELADPDRPRFFRNPDSASRWGAENADNLYLWARVRPDAAYRIFGVRGTAFDFLIEVKEGYMQLGDARNFATLRAGDIDYGADGAFEVLLSRERREGNWIPLDADARYIAIRQYLCDWATEEPARFEIERIDAVPSERATAADIGRALEDAGRWTLETARFWTEWTDRLRDAWAPGRVAPARKYEGGADDIYYGNDYYRVAAGEALVIETELPDARYWQFQLCDLWFRSADWVERQTSINHAQAAIDTDGCFRCVVADEDPGVPNWLDTGGQREGLLQYRFIESRTNPLPTVRTVPIHAVRDALPDDTPVVAPAERAAALRMRRRHRSSRERTS